ncbi:MAG: hypothetical protein U1F68_06980 [Gammaproteobacteria bacterium]
MKYPHSTYTALIVLGFLLILAGITIALHTRLPLEPESLDTVAGKRTLVCMGIGFYIILLASWLMRKTGVVGIIRPYRHLGFATTLVVLGFLVVLARVTLDLMKIDYGAQTMAAIPIAGAIVMVLGFLVNRSGRRVLRLPERN